jgi:hypothetical protein
MDLFHDFCSFILAGFQSLARYDEQYWSMVGAELALMTSTIERVIIAAPPNKGTVAATEIFWAVVAVSMTNSSTSWIRALKGIMAKTTMGTMHRCFIYNLESEDSSQRSSFPTTRVPRWIEHGKSCQKMPEKPQ